MRQRFAAVHDARAAQRALVARLGEAVVGAAAVAHGGEASVEHAAQDGARAPSGRARLGRAPAASGRAGRRRLRLPVMRHRCFFCDERETRVENDDAS